MKTFRNKKVGVLEIVSDEMAKQYEARPNIYELVEKTKENKEKTDTKKTKKSKLFNK